MADLNLAIYEIISLDVWGDRGDYEINAAYTTGRTVALPENPKLDDVLKALRASGELNRAANTRTVCWSPETLHNLDGNELTICRKKNGYPLLTLRKKTPPTSK
jgi:hypothetical protein